MQLFFLASLLLHMLFALRYALSETNCQLNRGCFISNPTGLVRFSKEDLQLLPVLKFLIQQQII
jgi:hypothetical protein